MWHLLALFACSFLVTGCSSTPDDVSPGEASEDIEWWNEPGSIKEYLAAVGASAILNPRMVRQARRGAEVDARAKLAATLKARITSLTENWDKSVGDMMDEKSFSAYVNDETFTRQYVDEKISGSQVVKYKQQGQTMFALLVLRDPTEWVNNITDDLEEKALKDETLLKTEVLKDDFRQRMEALKAEEEKKIQDQRSAFDKAVGSR
jgi:hypothetical protein